MQGISFVISALAGATISAQAIEHYIHGYDSDRYTYGNEGRTLYDFDLPHSEEEDVVRKVAHYYAHPEEVSRS